MRSKGVFCVCLFFQTRKKRERKLKKVFRNWFSFEKRKRISNYKTKSTHTIMFSSVVKNNNNNNQRFQLIEELKCIHLVRKTYTFIFIVHLHHLSSSSSFHLHNQRIYHVESSLIIRHSNKYAQSLHPKRHLRSKIR